MYCHKITEGEENSEENSENGSQIDAPEKSPSQKPPSCSNTNFSLHSKGIMRNFTPHAYSIFCFPYYFSVTKIITLI